MIVREYFVRNIKCIVLKIHRIQGPCSIKVKVYKLKIGKIGDFPPKNANSDTFGL
jgi:hypothetical protein